MKAEVTFDELGVFELGCDSLCGEFVAGGGDLNAICYANGACGTKDLGLPFSSRTNDLCDTGSDPISGANAACYANVYCLEIT